MRANEVGVRGVACTQGATKSWDLGADWATLCWPGGLLAEDVKGCNLR